MTRIMLQPEQLQALGAAFLASAEKLSTLVGRSTSAFHQLDWESRRRHTVETDVAEVQTLGTNMSEAAQGLSHFLRQKAEEFAALDESLAARVAQVAAGASAVAGSAAAVQSVTGVRTGGDLAEGAREPGGTVAPSGSSPSGIPGDFAKSPEELRQKFQSAKWESMAPWSDLIWTVSQETGLPPEIIAANMMQESGGDPNANAGKDAGKGLMQIEFSAHKSAIPGETDQEKLAWIFQPENNVRFGARIMQEHLDTWIAKYGPDEGLKRGLQYWNYGSGAAQWVEEHSKSPEDWQYWVNHYHDTHLNEDGTWKIVPSGGNYGTPLHWRYVYKHYADLQSAQVAVGGQ